MITKHLHAYLISKKIPFKTLGFGVQIQRSYYDLDTFKYLNPVFLDSTFIVNYPK